MNLWWLILLAIIFNVQTAESDPGVKLEKNPVKRLPKNVKNIYDLIKYFQLTKDYPTFEFYEHEFLMKEKTQEWSTQHKSKETKKKARQLYWKNKMKRKAARIKIRKIHWAMEHRRAAAKMAKKEAADKLRRHNRDKIGQDKRKRSLETALRRDEKRERSSHKKGAKAGHVRADSDKSYPGQKNSQGRC